MTIATGQAALVHLRTAPLKVESASAFLRSSRGTRSPGSPALGHVAFQRGKVLCVATSRHGSRGMPEIAHKEGL